MARQEGQQDGGISGLRQMGLKTVQAGAFLVLGRAVSGESNESRAGGNRLTAELVGNAEAVEAGQADIAQDDIGAPLHTQAHALRTRVRHLDLMPHRLEELSQRVAAIAV